MLIFRHNVLILTMSNFRHCLNLYIFKINIYAYFLLILCLFFERTQTQQRCGFTSYTKQYTFVYMLIFKHIYVYSLCEQFFSNVSFVCQTCIYRCIQQFTAVDSSLQQFTANVNYFAFCNFLQNSVQFFAITSNVIRYAQY